MITLYGTGEGALTPASVDGALAISTPFAKPTAGAVAVTIGGLPAEVLYSGAAPLLPAGVLQINVRVPVSAPSGEAPIVVTIVGDATTRRVTVAVK